MLGPAPLLTEEVEQHLTIASNGRVWFSGYNFGEEGRYVRGRTSNFHLNSEVANRILTVVGKYFSHDYESVFATDIGNWELLITNSQGKTYTFKGSLCEGLVVDGADLSDLIRDTLDMPDLFVFDGKDKPDRVNRIAIDYHWITKIKCYVPINDKADAVTWDYSEKLILDRSTDTLEHTQHIGSGCTVSRNYYV